MSGQVQLHAESFRSVLIEMLYCPEGLDAGDAVDPNWTVMAHGSAFVYRLDGQDHLVTARHNVTGRHWQTNEFLGKYSSGPTHLRVWLSTERPENWQVERSEDDPRHANIQVRLFAHLVPLVDEEWLPTWTQHPALGADMDVAVLPFHPPDDVVVMSWEREVVPRTGPEQCPWPPQLFPGEDVFVVGYPYRLMTGPILPLWIRGTVASNPVFGYHDGRRAYPLWLVDARTRKGQSGSPVMRSRSVGTIVVRNDGRAGITQFPDSELLGVYSGRTSDESDLGFVWPMDEVDEICRNGAPGTIF